MRKILLIAIIVTGAAAVGFTVWQKFGTGQIIPSNDEKGTITGTVMLGPACPIVKDPPDPQCADKPYKTTLQIIEIGSPRSSPFAVAESDSQGRYSMELPAGEYSVQVIGDSPIQHCNGQTVTVEPNITKEVNLSCDTGIR